jgi:hypothetical protein
MELSRKKKEITWVEEQSSKEKEEANRCERKRE